jgi:hypothetical protein
MIVKEKLKLPKPTENRGNIQLAKVGAIALGGMATVWGINFVSLQVPLMSRVNQVERWRQSG